MKSNDVERASARMGDVCPAQASEFGRVAAAIDEADRVGGERIGGPTRAEVSAERKLWKRLSLLRPDCAADWQWLAKWLARALINGWTPRAAAPLIRLADGGEA